MTKLLKGAYRFHKVNKSFNKLQIPVDSRVMLIPPINKKFHLKDINELLLHLEIHRFNIKIVT